MINSSARCRSSACWDWPRRSTAPTAALADSAYDFTPWRRHRTPPTTSRPANGARRVNPGAETASPPDASPIAGLCAPAWNANRKVPRNGTELIAKLAAPGAAAQPRARELGVTMETATMAAVKAFSSQDTKQMRRRMPTVCSCTLHGGLVYNPAGRHGRAPLVPASAASRCLVRLSHADRHPYPAAKDDARSGVERGGQDAEAEKWRSFGTATQTTHTPARHARGCPG